MPWVVLLGVRLQKAAIIGAEAVIVIKAAATVVFVKAVTAVEGTKTVIDVAV